MANDEHVTTMLNRLWRNFCLMLGNQPSLTLYLMPLLQAIRPGFVPGLYRARIIRKDWQTPDMLKLRIKVSGRWPGFVPGQHLLLSLQHNGKNLTRPFSICSPFGLWQAKRQIELCCKVNRQGDFTPLLTELVQGSMINISAAQGDFYWQQPSQATLFIAAGSGITPIASMLLSQRHWLAPATLLYRVRGSENAALLQQLQQLAACQPLFKLQLSDSRYEHSEHFNQTVIETAAGKKLYLCGPAAFMQQVKHTVLQAGVAENNLYQEQFGPQVLVKPAAGDNNQLHQISFQSATGTARFNAPASSSLLQSAEKQGLTPQFGCRIGVCFQCVCDKLSGQVRDIRSGALSGHGNEQIQLCISQPVTDLVLKQ